MLPHLNFSFLNRFKAVSLALTLQCILTATVYPQLQRTTLGSVTEHRAVKNPAGVFTGDFNGDGHPDLGTYNSKQALLQLHTPDSLQWESFPLQLEGGTISKVIGANCNGDKMTDLIVLDAKSASIRIFLVKYGLIFYVRSTLRFKDELPDIVVADINNDTKTDILVFGKRESGITVYAGNGGGGFTKTSTLQPQKSFSNVTVSDMNGDKINDIVAIDWLANEVNVVKGFGKMKFGDPFILRYEWEPGCIASGDINHDTFNELAVSFVNRNEVLILKGNGTGEFERKQTILPHSTPTSLMFADMNNDTMSDLLMFSSVSGVLSIQLGEERCSVQDAVEYSCGREAKEFVLFPSGKSDTLNVASAAAGNSVVRVMYNCRSQVPFEPELTYALGRTPASVLSFDIIGNDKTDIAVLDKQSKIISLLLNTGETGLNGQVAFPIPIEGTTFQYAVKEKNNSYFIIMNPEEEKLSVTEFNTQTFKYASNVLPVQKNSDLLARYVEKNTKFLNFFVLSNTDNPKQAALVKYSQLGPAKYIEENVISRFEPSLVTAVMGDFDKDNDFDLAFLGFNAGREMLELRSIFRSETTKVNQPRLDFALKAKESVPALMWSSDVTGDGYPDLIINLQKPKNDFMISVNGNHEMFQLPRFHSPVPISVAYRNQLKVIDVNGDKKMDIVIYNSLTKEIQVLWGSGNGTFPTVSRLIGAEGIGGFTFADFDNDNFQELIVTDSLNGWLKIISLNR